MGWKRGDYPDKYASCILVHPVFQKRYQKIREQKNCLPRTLVYFCLRGGESNINKTHITIYHNVLGLFILRNKGLLFKIFLITQSKWNLLHYGKILL